MRLAFEDQEVVLAREGEDFLAAFFSRGHACWVAAVLATLKRQSDWSRLLSDVRTGTV